MKRLFLFLALLTCSSCQAPQGGPPLVVVIVIDQMRPDYFDGLGVEFDGGLRRVLDEGYHYSMARYRHAPTDTGPGHATISTGRRPNEHGFVGNRWYDRDRKELIACTDDPNATAVIGGSGKNSPRRMLATSVGDWLKRASPRSHVVSLAYKSRSAIPMGGQRPDIAVWLEGEQFVSSSYYGNDAPEWLRDFDLQLPRDPETEIPISDGPLFELAQTAQQAMGLGEDDYPDILFLSCSAADYVGHVYGPRSQQLRDYFVTLDAELGKYLDHLDASVGPDRYRIVMTSDHGVVDFPEDLAADGADARRMLRDECRAASDAIGESFGAALGLDASAFEYTSGDGIVFTAEAKAAADASDLAWLEAELRTVPFIDAAYALGSDIEDGDPYREIYANAYVEGRSPDIAMRGPANWLIYSRSSGTDHGSPYEYDARVPLVLFGQGMPVGESIASVEVTQIAPTIAEWLGVPVPGDLPFHALPKPQ